MKEVKATCRFMDGRKGDIHCESDLFVHLPVPSQINRPNDGYLFNTINSSRLWERRGGGVYIFFSC